MKKIAQEGDFIIARMRSYLEEMAIVEEKEVKQLFPQNFWCLEQRQIKFQLILYLHYA